MHYIESFRKTLQWWKSILSVSVCDNNSIQATSHTPWDLFLICLSGLRWPISIHFINLFVASFSSPNGGDYSNLAWNTSTSDIVTPFCCIGHYGRTHINRLPPPNKHPLVYVSQWVEQGCCYCQRCLFHIMAKRHSWELQACVSLWSMELLGELIWDDLALAIAEMLYEPGSMRHGFMSFQ